jgi:hypothetical protein
MRGRKWEEGKMYIGNISNKNDLPTICVCAMAWLAVVCALIPFLFLFSLFLLSLVYITFLLRRKNISLPQPLGVDCCCCVTFKYAQRRWYVDDQSHYRAKRNKISGKPRVSSAHSNKIFERTKKNFLHILNFLYLRR